MNNFYQMYIQQLSSDQTQYLQCSYNIEDHIEGEDFLPNVHSTIRFTSDSILAAHDNIEDHAKDE